MKLRLFAQIILSFIVSMSAGQTAMAEQARNTNAGSPGVAGAPASQNAASAFQSLEQEAEGILKEVLNLSSDLAVISERENNPPKNQLMVLVTQAPTNLFELTFIELRVDNQVVAAYHYTERDLFALSRGGGHRLYLANLPAGSHELSARMLGRIPRDPDYRREADFSFVSGVSRSVIELKITNANSKGFPTLLVKEWN